MFGSKKIKKRKQNVNNNRQGSKLNRKIHTLINYRIEL